MAKFAYEIAGEVASEVTKARAQAIAEIDSISVQTAAIEKYLSDEAIKNLIKSVGEAIIEEVNR